MVIVSHELESIFALADRIVMLDKETKGIIAEGNPIQLKKSSSDSRVRDFLNRYVGPLPIANLKTSLVCNAKSSEPVMKYYPVLQEYAPTSARYYTPDEFEDVKRYGMEIGFRWVESGPLVRSSYHAEQQVRALSAIHRAYPGTD